MDAPSEELAVAGGTVPEGAPPSNRGWFRPGDRRINREGRPRGSKAAVPTGTRPADRAPYADRLKRLFVGERQLNCSLSRERHPWVINLPPDFRIVACRVDTDRQGVVFTIRSESFPRVAQGAPIPEFTPEFYGLKWC
jgi:hypothetical protein